MADIMDYPSIKEICKELFVEFIDSGIYYDNIPEKKERNITLLSKIISCPQLFLQMTNPRIVDKDWRRRSG